MAKEEVRYSVKTFPTETQNAIVDATTGEPVGMEELIARLSNDMEELKALFVKK